MPEQPSPGEQPLSGGRSRAGVVRSGTTVRRPLTPRSPFVHRVLRRLESAGVDGVPRFLGIDDQNREILTYLDGDTGHAIADWTDTQLADVARLVRAIHDALAGAPEAGDAETVCHLDLAPWNTILRADRPIAFIDFDDVAPGNRSDDLAYLLWTFLDLGSSPASPQTQAARVRAFCDVYAERLSSADQLRADLLPALDRQQHRILAFRASRSDSFSATKHAEILRSIAWAHEHRVTLAAQLA